MALSLPKPFAQIPRARLLYPDPSSPIHPLQALTASLNNSTTNPSDHPSPHISLYAKREDHSSPLACAGNKYRKLEYIIPDILSPTNSDQSQGQDKTKVTTLVTEGAIQSNHTIQVAAVAHKLSLEALIILHKQTGGGLASSTDKNTFLRVGNVQIAKLLGAEVRMLEKSSTITTAGSHDPIPGILDELRAQGKVPYWIPSGASLHPLGGLGYARCAFEIAAQEEQMRTQTQTQTEELSGTGRFDYIFVACGSGSTIGGLVAGFKLLDKQANQHQRPPRKIIGILTSPTMPREYHEGRILRFARTAAGMIGLDPEQDITMDDVHLDERFVGTAYGALDPEAKQALAMMARVEGVIVDPVYTAKVVRGLVHWVQSGELGRDWASTAGVGAMPAPTGQANALFIHTGGQSALGAYADID